MTSMRLLLAASLALLAVPSAASAAFPGANGRIAYVCDYADRTAICTVNADGTDWKRLTSPSTTEGWCPRDRDPAWAADGRKIAFARELHNGQGCSTEVFVMNADGSGQTKVTDEEGTAEHPAW